MATAHSVPRAGDFRAPRWLSSPHLQTLGASLPLWAAPRSFHGARARIPLPGGGSLHARTHFHPGPEGRLAAVLVHGLGGTSESRYVVRAALGLYRAGL